MFKTSRVHCKYCDEPCIKKGFRNTIQQYYCKQCCKYQRSVYKNRFVTERDRVNIVRLNNEGMGIRNISRFLRISASNVIYQIKQLAATIRKSIVNEQNQEYEIDELHTYIGKNIPANYCWITYAINRKTKQVIDWVVCKRTKENFQKVVNSVLALHPRRIYTDGLNIYKNLISKSLHRVQSFRINYIERKNFTIRTHLKRLSRRTICFSRSVVMLIACLKIYFWA